MLQFIVALFFISDSSMLLFYLLLGLFSMLFFIFFWFSPSFGSPIGALHLSFSILPSPNGALRLTFIFTGKSLSNDGKSFKSFNERGFVKPTLLILLLEISDFHLVHRHFCICFWIKHFRISTLMLQLSWINFHDFLTSTSCLVFLGALRSLFLTFFF